MRFKITGHSGYAAPDGAVDLLWQELGAGHEDVTFAREGGAITATLGEDAPVAMTHDERVEIGRRAVLAVVTDVCERAPGLQSDWFAVGIEG